MFFNDHAPPHFHAIIGPHEAQVDIATGKILAGRLPPNARRLVQMWALRYHAELMGNWERAMPNSRQPLQRIPGLDADDD